MAATVQMVPASYPVDGLGRIAGGDQEAGGSLAPPVHPGDSYSVRGRGFLELFKTRGSFLGSHLLELLPRLIRLRFAGRAYAHLLPRFDVCRQEGDASACEALRLSSSIGCRFHAPRVSAAPPSALCVRVRVSFTLYLPPSVSIAA